MSSQTFSLIVSIPGQDPTQHELAEGKATLGRGPDNTIQVLVAEVSVSHAVLEVGADATTIADVGSTNGTQVNGKSISAEPVTLNPMDKLLLGNTVPAYFVPSAIAANGSLSELIESLEKDAEEQSAPVAVAVSGGAPAAPVAPAKPGLPAVAKPGAPTPIQPAAPAAGGGPPAPVAPAKPAPVAPAAAGASTVKLAQVKPTAPGVGGPAQPAAPKLGAPAAAPGAPAAPVAPAGGPAAPKPAPVPLKKPEPAAPKIPLPGKKPEA